VLLGPTGHAKPILIPQADLSSECPGRSDAGHVLQYIDATGHGEEGE